MERLLRHNEEDFLFKGKNIYCRNEPLFEGCGNSLVYHGYFKKTEDSKEEIAVRKIKVTDCCDQWVKDSFNKHTREDSIKHENVLKIIGYEEMDEWRFFALERYDASLEQFCKGIYKGPMPSDAQVLCQIAEGLLYLHAEQCTHGNLTPRTILIASSQPVRMMIKLSEFGMSKIGDQSDEEMVKQEDICQRKCWRLDGTTADSNQTSDYNHDIFSAGCICFYFLKRGEKRGVHPFGDNSSSILENMKERNPVNLKTLKQEKDIWEFAYEPIKNMIGDPPIDGRNWLLIAKTCFMKALSLRFEEKKENKLGSGAYGVVYKGTFEGNPVAVKIFIEHPDDADQKREMEEHLRLDHENVLKLLYVDELRHRKCLVLELCAGTLRDYCEDRYKGPMPPDGLVLYQIANGLNYIHSQCLVHRDVNPNNILISITTPVQMKLSDFGLVKKTSLRGTCTQRSQLIGLKGTPHWTIGPEKLEFWDKVKKSKRNNTSLELLHGIIKSVKWVAGLVISYPLTRNNTSLELPHGTIKSDIWAAGLVFFYFLTRGKHPYGDPSTISANIEHNNPIEFKLHIQNLQSDDRALYELIGKMINPIGQRISLPDVIEQLTTNLIASCQFKRVVRLVGTVSSGGEWCVARFHPKKLVLAWGIEDEIIFFSAKNSSIPFSNWKEDEKKFQIGHKTRITTMEWNADGTQLAAIFNNKVTVWSYPSGEILKRTLDESNVRIEWNIFRPNVFAILGGTWILSKKVFFFNSRPVDQRPFHFCTIKREEEFRSFQWISENRVALGLWGGGIIEILKIDKSTKSAKLVKLFQHGDNSIADLAWDERTKCLAACSDDGWLSIWSMDSDQPIHATKVDGTCCSLAWRPNGKPTDDESLDAARKSADNFILAGGLSQGKIVIWTPLAKEKTKIVSQHSNLVHSLSFSPDGRFLASADRDGTLIIWATEDWEPVFIGKEERSVELHRFSWLSSSTDVPDFKLTFDLNDDKVHVVENAVSQSEISSQD